MLLAQRHQQIVEALSAGGLTVVQLAETLDVSESTIRRDLDALAKEGLLERKYGGAMLTAGSRAVTTDSGDREPAVGDGSRVDLDLRTRVAASAVELISDGEVVVLDIGETTPLIARLLRSRHVTIITANLAVLDELRDDDATEVVLLGGVLRRNQQSLVGPITVQAVESLTADLMFLSCTGVRNGAVVDHMAVEAPIKHALVEAAERVILLASETKFPGSGAMRVCPLDDVDVIITTDGIPNPDLEVCREGGRKVIIA